MDMFQDPLMSETHHLSLDDSPQYHQTEDQSHLTKFCHETRSNINRLERSL